MHFTEEELEDETRSEWYLRQILGAANFKGGPLLHILSGNLGFQIEHHLYPDLPSNRYAEIAPRIQEICERYGLSYTTGPLVRQVASAWKQVVVLSLPNPEPGRTRVGIAAEAVGKRVRRKLGGRPAGRRTARA
jgi:linoleoyl-CoA desaturase